MTTFRQAEANKRNATHSTGPRTQEGKEVSKRNALKHGLAGAGTVLPEDEEAEIRERYERWAAGFGPVGEYQCLLGQEIAFHSFRLEQCHRHDGALRTTLAARASACWDEDRQLGAEQLGKTLPRQPALVVKQLEQSPQGCDWLTAHWESLGRIWAEKGEWSDPQRSHALDLLGTPAELRDDPARLAGDLGELVRREVERISRRKSVMTPFDERDRTLTVSGRAIEPNASMKNLRRYEARIARQLNWSTAQFYRVTLGLGLSHPTLGAPPAMTAAVFGRPDPPVAESPAPEPKPEPKPEPEPKPDPEPEPAATKSIDEVPILTAPVPDLNTNTNTNTNTSTKTSKTGPSKMFTPKPPRNRRERRAQEARARKLLKV